MIEIEEMHSRNQTNSTISLTYSSAIKHAIEHEMHRDSAVFLYGLDVDDHKGIQGSTLGLQEIFGEERVFTTPLSEDAMTGVGIGAAMAGLRPIHVHIRMDFLLLCMNQLINMAAKAHYMYEGQLQVPMVIRAMIGRSWGQGAQHSQALYSLFSHIPGLKIVAPANPHDAQGLMLSAIRDNNPVIFVEHRLLYGMESYIPKDPKPIPLGKARIMAEGKDITIVSISHMVLESMRAAEFLKIQGISCEIIDLRSIRPLDIETINHSVNKTKRLLIVDNAWLNCGISAEIMAQITETNNGFSKMARLGFIDTTCPTTRCLEEYFYPNPKTIAEKVLHMITGLKKSFKFEASKEIAAFKGPF